MLRTSNRAFGPTIPAMPHIDLRLSHQRRPADRRRLRARAEHLFEEVQVLARNARPREPVAGTLNPPAGEASATVGRLNQICNGRRPRGGVAFWRNHAGLTDDVRNFAAVTRDYRGPAAER